jgi:hypothetical protein
MPSCASSFFYCFGLGFPDDENDDENDDEDDDEESEREEHGEGLGRQIANGVDCSCSSTAVISSCPCYLVLLFNQIQIAIKFEWFQI